MDFQQTKTKFHIKLCVTNLVSGQQYIRWHTYLQSCLDYDGRKLIMYDNIAQF
jgi:hypothetical protein